MLKIHRLSTEREVILNLSLRCEVVSVVRRANVREPPRTHLGSKQSDNLFGAHMAHSTQKYLVSLA